MGNDDKLSPNTHGNNNSNSNNSNHRFILNEITENSPIKGINRDMSYVSPKPRRTVSPATSTILSNKKMPLTESAKKSLSKRKEVNSSNASDKDNDNNSSYEDDFVMTSAPLCLYPRNEIEISDMELHFDDNSKINQNPLLNTSINDNNSNQIKDKVSYTINLSFHHYIFIMLFNYINIYYL
jgi:hypothetical protein